MHEIRYWTTDTRYYRALLQRDLFGMIVMSTCWGGRQNRLGGVKTLCFDDETQALQALQRLSAKREAHGYRLLK
jgi:predicted DNA-binding WGR domain protein